MANRTALTRATESTDSPTPGYLYNDISKSVSASPVACTETVNYLVRRLGTKTNHNIKYKCLKVMQMVATNPLTKGQFKRALCQDITGIATIKECLNFRGRPDPVHGEQIYIKVREQAKETLDAIYSDFPSSEQGGSTGMANMVGFGSGSYGGNGGGYANSVGVGRMPNVPSGPKKMEGIGNPMFKDPRSEGDKELGEMTVGDIVHAAKEGFAGMIKDPLARGSGRASLNTDRHRISQWNSKPPGASQLAHATGGAWTMASNRGPNAIGGGNNTYHKSGASSGISSGVGGSWASENSVASQSRFTGDGRSLPPSGNVVNIPGSTGVAASDGTYERNLIQELCPPGGMRAEPPEEKLESFKQAIPSLNPDLVCPALLDALEDGQPWIIRAKVLCVMETSILVAEETRVEGGNNTYADFFHACRDEIEPLATHTRSAVRDPARRVLKALGLEVTVQPKDLNKNRAPSVTAVAASSNLLDFDNVTSEDLPSMPPPPEVPLVPQVNKTLALTSSSASSDQGNSLFGGMNIKNDTEKIMAPPTTLSTPKAVEGIGTDLLGVTENTKVNISDGLFGGDNDEGKLNENTIDGSENISPEAKIEESTGSTSGFSFMSNAKNTENSSKSPSANKDTFDPLLSTETRVIDQKAIMQQPMQINPQVAAAYQQQIMMMQMQMQKMQIAGGSSPYMMMQHPQKQGSSRPFGSKGSLMTTALGGKSTQVMGATNGSGVATSFAFMEDPAKVKREASNKKFDFVQDAMKDAK